MYLLVCRCFPHKSNIFFIQPLKEFDSKGRFSGTYMVMYYLVKAKICFI